jgi:membrane fusion protein (multidrug efflux system)
MICAASSTEMEKVQIYRRLAMIGGISGVVVGSAAFWLCGDRFVETDNAYIHAAKLMVTTDVSGIVQSVDVRHGQSIRKGQVLFRLDPAAFQNTVDSERAALDQTALNLEALKSSYRSHLGSIEAQHATTRLAQITYNRYLTLAKSGAISTEKLDDARKTLQSARGTLTSTEQSAATELAKLKGDPDLPLEDYPDYRKAKAALAEAERQFDHTVVRAPFDAVVSEVDALRPGMLIVSSISSFTTTSAVGIVSPSDLWVSADMKETDLTYVRQGNPVEIAIDAYPGHIWHGIVETVNSASDTAFSILPSQNSSANWVKVVQRIPVRIKIARRADDPPLSAGMSVVVTIDTGRRRWQRLFVGK